jgi:hypothetical protein
MSDRVAAQSSRIELDARKLLLLGGDCAVEACNPRMVGFKMINLRGPANAAALAPRDA